MAYKIHKRGAFVIIENTVNGELKELNSQFVQITKGKTSLDQYEVLYNGVSQLKAVLGDIQDANGVAYVEADWDIFRYEQCGSVNSSEVANPYPAPTTAVVNISSAQMLNGDSVELFTIPNGSTLRSLEVFAVYTEGSISYTPSGGNYYIIGDLNNGDIFIRIHKDLFTWWVTEGVPVVNNYVWNSNMIDNGTPDSSIVGGHLTGTTDNSVHIKMNSLILADGNGTLDLHCTYSFITL